MRQSVASKQSTRSDATGAEPVSTSFQPPLRYRVTGRCNVVLWRLPLPRRVTARLSTLLYRNPPMPAELVLRTMDALRAAGVPAWIGGGWGVDALTGDQTRDHSDLDVVIDMRAQQAALEALQALGYWEWYRFDIDRPLFSRIVMHDHDVAGRAIDLHPLDTSLDYVQFTTGTIEGVTVPCLSIDSQLTTHSNYRKRWRDRLDLAILRKLTQKSPLNPPPNSSR